MANDLELKLKVSASAGDAIKAFGDLKRSLSDMSQAVAAAQAKTTDLAREFKTNQQRADELRLQYALGQRELARLAETTGKSAPEYRALDAEIKQMAADLKAADAATARSEKAFEAAKREAAGLKSQLDAMRQSVHQHREALRAQGVDVSHLAAEYTRLQNAAQLAQQAQDRQGRVDGARATLGLTPHAETHSRIADITDGERQSLRQTQALLDELGNSGQATATRLQSVFMLLWAQMTGMGVDALGYLSNAFKSNSFFQQAEPALNKIKTAFTAVAQVAAAVKQEITGSLKTFAQSLAAETVIEWRGVKFEANFADVKKVVSGSVDSIKNLSKELLDMSAEIAMPIAGLAKMQAIAGQLGFPIDKIGAFVKLVSKGAVAFELLPEQAAAAFGNLKNIYNLNLVELEFLGDQINYIADKANTNEAALLDVMNRAGGTAQRFGLLRGETIALASAMLSMGKPPELVGTAMDILLSRLQNAKNQSRDFQDGLQLLGTDAKTLAENIEKNPKKALDGLLASLSKLTPASQTDVLSRLIGEAGEAKGVIGDLVGKLGEYQRLTELSKAGDIAGSMEATFQERQKTVQAALVMMKNAWDGLAVSATTMFLPTVRAVVEGFRDLALWLRQVNEEYPNLMGFARIALIFGTLGNVFSLVFNRITAWAAGMGASLVAELVGPLSKLPVLAAWLLNSFWGRLVAGAVLVTVGFNGLLAAVTALASGFTTLISHPVALFLAGLAFVAARIALASSLFAGLGVAVSGFGATLLRLVGGPIGLAVSAIAFLVVKYNEIKDESVKFGNATTTLHEIIDAVWRKIAQAVSDDIDWIKQKFTELSDALTDLMGDHNHFWGKIKERQDQGVKESTTSLSDLLNGFIRAFASIGNTVAIRLDEAGKIMRLKFTEMVNLAKAAGQDIKAALTFDFSASNMKSVVADSKSQQTKIHAQADADIAASNASIAKFDYAGAIIESINQDIARHKPAKKTPPGENPPNKGGVDLPDLSGAGGGGSGGGKGGGAREQSPEQTARAEIDALEQGLTARKLTFEKTNLLLEFSKKEEKTYWDEVITNFKGSSSTLSQLKEKSARLDVDIQRDAAQQQQAWQAELSQMQRESALSDLDFKRQMADQELELGKITQAEHLARLKELAAEELALRLKILEDRRKLHLNDPVEQAKITAEEQQVMIKFRADLSGLESGELKAAKNDLKTLFEPLQNALDQSINGILTGQQTIANAARNAAQSVVLSYIQQSIKIRAIKVQDWLFEHTGMAKLLNDKKQFDLLETVWDAAMWARKRVRKTLEWTWEISGLAGAEARKRAIKQASDLYDDLLGKQGLIKQAANWVAETLGFGAKEATKAGIVVVSEEIQTGAKAKGEAERGAIEDTANAESSIKMAWQAAKGVFKSVMDALPFPFNVVIAPIAAAAAFAGTMALGSAKGGEYMVTEDGKTYRLHERESVLPADVADNFRTVVDIVRDYVAPTETRSGGAAATETGTGAIDRGDGAAPTTAEADRTIAHGKDTELMSSLSATAERIINNTRENSTQRESVLPAHAATSPGASDRGDGAAPTATVLPPAAEISAIVKNLQATGKLSAEWRLPQAVADMARDSQHSAQILAQNAYQHATQNTAARTENHYHNTTQFSPVYNNDFIDAAGAQRFAKMHARATYDQLKRLDRRFVGK